MLDYPQIIFRYSEIGLKGQNLRFYEKILQNNIFNTIKYIYKKELDFVIKFDQKQGKIYINSESAEKASKIAEKILLSLKYVSGIAWYAKVEQTVTTKEFASDYKVALDKTLKQLGTFYFENIVVKRYDKSLSFTSHDIWLYVRKYLRDLQDNKADVIQKSSVVKQYDIHSVNNSSNKDHDMKLKNRVTKSGNRVTSKQDLIILIHKNNVLFAVKKLGLGGLPVGATGKGIVLFSGGIDSPVASIMMANRGTNFSLLHFTPLSAQEIKKTKIYKLYKVLKLYNPYTKLYIANIPFIQDLLKNNNKLQSQKIYNLMILFKRLIVRIAYRFGAKLYKYNFITVLGDSLGQVSSQTISNMIATTESFYSFNNDKCSDSIKKSVLIRPLVGLNKDFIIDLAKKYGTYELSIQEYIDCCSRLAKNSKTETNLSKMQTQEAELDMNSIVGRSIETIQVVE